MRLVSTLLVFFTLFAPMTVFAHNPLPPGYKPPSGPYSSLQQNKSGLQDPIYQGNFQLSGAVHVDEKLMKVSEAASDIDFVLEQAATSMSTCIKIDEQKDRLERGYKVLDSNPSGSTVAANFRQVEAIIRQAKVEFEQYSSSRTRGNNAYNPHIRSGNELLMQAREKLKGSRPVINLLWKTAQGIAQASEQLAIYLNEIRKTQGASLPPTVSQVKPVTVPKVAPDIRSQIPPSYRAEGSSHPNLSNKLNIFFESLKQRALSETLDPTERERVITNLTEKFTGIGEGLNEAKEEVKTQAKRAFDETIRQTESFKKDPLGTIQKTKEASEEFASSMANSTLRALDEAAKDSNAFDRLLKNSVAMVAKSSAQYSQLSPKEQGKIIGKNLFWSVNPSGSIEGVSLASQSFNRAKTVIKPHMTELGAEINMLASAGKEQIANQKLKLQNLAERIGESHRPTLATSGPSMPTGPPGKSVLEDLYDLAKRDDSFSAASSSAGKAIVSKSKVSLGTKFGTVIADDLAINEGWALDGQKISKGLEWPNGWGKPSRGDYLTSNGKLYFRPDEASRAHFEMSESTLIPIEKGVPDYIAFSPDKTNHVYRGELSGIHKNDKILFVRSLAKNRWLNLSNEEAVKEFLRVNQLAIHHFSDFIDDSHLFQVVPRDIHRYFGHSGYAVKLRQAK